MGNTGVVAEVSGGQVKGLVRILDFIVRARFVGTTHSSPKCFKLDSSNLIRFEYLKEHCNYSVVIRLGIRWPG